MAENLETEEERRDYARRYVSPYLPELSDRVGSSMSGLGVPHVPYAAPPGGGSGATSGVADDIMAQIGPGLSAAADQAVTTMGGRPAPSAAPPAGDESTRGIAQRLAAQAAEGIGPSVDRAAAGATAAGGQRGIDAIDPSLLSGGNYSPDTAAIARQAVEGFGPSLGRAAAGAAAAGGAPPPALARQVAGEVEAARPPGPQPGTIQRLAMAATDPSMPGRARGPVRPAEAGREPRPDDPLLAAGNQRLDENDELGRAQEAAGRNRTIRGIGKILEGMFGSRDPSGAVDWSKGAARDDRRVSGIRARIEREQARQSADAQWKERHQTKRGEELEDRDAASTAAASAQEGDRDFRREMAGSQQGFQRDMAGSQQDFQRDMAGAKSDAQQRASELARSQSLEDQEARREHDRGMVGVRGDDRIRVGAAMHDQEMQQAAVHGRGAREMQRVSGERPVGGPPRTPVEGVRSALQAQVAETDWRDTPGDQAARQNLETIAGLYDEARRRGDRETMNDLQREFRETMQTTRGRRETEREHVVPGWARAPGAPNLSQAERGKVRDVDSSFRQLRAAVSELVEMADEVTALEAAGSSMGILSDRMARARHLQEQVSNSNRKIGDYGVPQAAELERMEGMAPRLDSVAGFLSGAAIYRQMIPVAAAATQAQMQSFGYSPSEPLPTGLASRGQQRSGGGGRPARQPEARQPAPSSAPVSMAGPPGRTVPGFVETDERTEDGRAIYRRAE